MDVTGILMIVSTVLAIVRTGALTYAEVTVIFAKYEGIAATPESIEALRQELLNEAKIPDAVDDPRIRAILETDGIDPETLRIS